MLLGKIYLKNDNFFSWKQILISLGKNNEEILYSISPDQAVLFALDMKVTQLFKVKHNSKLNKFEVNLIKGKKLSLREWKIVEEYVINWFGLKYSPNKFYEYFCKSRSMKPLIEKYYGLPIIGTPNLYEALTWGIIGQQISMKSAYKIKSRFIKKYGCKIDFNEEEYWIYPKPDIVQNVTVEELSSIGLPKKRAQYLLNVTEAFLSGKIDEGDIRKMEYEEARKLLLSIKGVGPWTAGIVLMSSLHFSNIFLGTDAKLLNGLKKIYRLDSKPDKKLLKKIESIWGDYSSYAMFYMWQDEY